MTRKQAPKPKRLLAIDTSASVGLAALDYYEQGDKPPSLIYTDAFPTDTSLSDAERYEVVRSAVVLFCYKYGPFDAVVREHFIKAGSKRGTQLVFGGWAAVDMALKAFGYVISDDNEMRVSTVKKAVGLTGKADKKAVEQGVRQALKLPDDYVFPNNKGGDSSDACAIGLAWLQREGVI